MNRRILMSGIGRHASPVMNNVRRMFDNEGGAEQGAAGGGGVDFEATPIPADKYADNPNIAKYKTIGDLVKGHGEAVKLVGAKGIIVPGEKATPEEWEKYYNSTGRPEKPEGYKLSPLENLHPDLKITPESEAGFKALMHKHGLTTRQADGLYKEYFGMISGSLIKRDETMQASKHEAERTLRTEWGAEYDANLAKTKRLIEKFGGADAREAFGELGNNPKVLKTLAGIAKRFSEDGYIKGIEIPDAEKNNAQKQLNDIYMNKQHPYWNQGVGHAEAVAEVKRLNSIVHPEIEA